MQQRRNSKKETVYERFNCKMKRETEKAVLLVFGDKLERWIPKKCIKHDFGDFYIAQWFFKFLSVDESFEIHKHQAVD